jgi:hypothetical protein
MKILLILLTLMSFCIASESTEDEVMCILHNKLSYKIDIQMLIGDGKRVTFYKTEVIEDKKVLKSDFMKALTALPFTQGEYNFGTMKIYRLFCDKKSIWLTLIHPPYQIEKTELNDIPLGSYIQIHEDTVLY